MLSYREILRDNGEVVHHMTNAVPGQSVTDLAVIRQAIRNSFGDDDNEAADLANMDRLYEIEAKIETATFEVEADKRAGNSILMEDKPSRWDNFQESLFLRMQQFA